MQLPINDPRVINAIGIVKKIKNPDEPIDKAFENYYHCKLIYSDPWCVTGWVEIEEEKYQTLFLLQNG